MLVLREGAGVGGARLYCSGKDANVATNAEGGQSPTTHTRKPGAAPLPEREGVSPAHSAPSPRAAQCLAPCVTHLCPRP